MAVSALVFSGKNSLDSFELRMGVVRIPEVLGRVREAQRILDSQDLAKTDLLNIICSGDEVFKRDARMRSLLVAIVQVGLYDRFLKTQRHPDYFVGLAKADSAVRVASGVQSFQDLILNSSAIEALKGTEQRILSLVTELTLTWQESDTEEFCVLGAAKEAPVEENGQHLSLARDGFSDLRQTVLALSEERGVTRFIHIGPAGGLKSFDYNQLGNDEIEALDSIELDPMLGWFWRTYRGVQLDPRPLAN